MRFLEEAQNLREQLASCVAGATGLSASSVVLAFLAGVALWIMMRGGGAILGEYFKRAWWYLFHSNKLDQTKIKIEQLEKLISSLQSKIIALIESIFVLTQENKRLRRMLISNGIDPDGQDKGQHRPAA